MKSFLRLALSGFWVPVAAASLISCGAPAPELPQPHVEAAATCYAATVAQFSDPVTAEQVNKAAQFLFLGAVNDGLASPSVLQRAATLGNELQDVVTKGGDGSRYNAPCAARFPQTAAGQFKALPADNRDTRMMCLTLSTSLLQTYQSSDVSPPAATTAMNAKLDRDLMAELNADPDINHAEIAGIAMRAMAKAAELGPSTDVIAACGDRYGKSG